MSDNEKAITHLALFEEKTVRRVWYQDRWFFSIIDVIGILSESSNARRYWSDLKRKLIAEGYDQVYEKIVQLKMTAPDGKNYVTDAADSTTLLRIIQSIPSPRAEPFKRLLAETGRSAWKKLKILNWRWNARANFIKRKVTRTHG